MRASALRQAILLVGFAFLPAIGQALNATTAQTQLTISTYLIGFAVGQIVYGPISDRFGRKPVMLVALVLYFLRWGISP